MDDFPLRDRLEHLEARVAQLERLLGERSPAPPLAPPPAAPSPPPPPPRTGRVVQPPPLPPDPSFAARAVAPPPEPKDLERFVGLAVLGRVGIGALLLAAAYFGKLGWDQLGPTARATLVYVSGLALIGVGAWLRPRVEARYTAMLWGGGVALTYLAGVLGYLRFEVLSSPVAIVSLLTSAALGQLLAHRLRLEVLATVALGGAYAAPVLVGSPSPTPTGFFTLLLVLHTWAAWTEHRWRWHQARALAVIATVGLVYAWYVNAGITSVWSFVWHVEAVWLLLIAPEVLAAVHRRELSTMRAVLAGLGGLYVHAQLLGHLFDREQQSSFGLGAAVVLLAGGALLVPRSAALGSWLARVGSCVLPFGVILWAASLPAYETRVEPAWWCVACLAGAAALLFAVRRWTRVAELGMAITAPLAIVMGQVGQLGRGQTALVLAIPLLLLVTGRSTIARTAGLVFAAIAPFFTLHPLGRFGSDDGDCTALAVALVCGTATLALFVGACARDRVLIATAAVGEVVVLFAWLMISVFSGADPAVSTLTPFWNTRAAALAAIVALAIAGRTLLSPAEGTPRAVLGATALAGTYIGGLLELLDIMAPWNDSVRDVATSFYTLAFAGALLAAGFWKKVPALRWIALTAFGIIALKIVAWDLKDFDTPLRVLATGVLGGVLLLAAWAYARGRRRADQPSS